MNDQYIQAIYDSLKMSSLDEKTIALLSQFMDAYHQTLDAHLNSQMPNSEITSQLQILTGPINAAIQMQDGATPAADFIKEKLHNHGMEMEKGFAKVLKNPNAPSVQYEEEQMSINGYSFAIIVVFSTIILGVILGAILFFTK